MITTWFLRDEPETSSHFPNIYINSADPRAGEIYLRCVYCFFVTSLAVNPGVAHIFFTNSSRLELEGADFLAMLKQLGVQVVNLPLTYRVPPTWHPEFRNQFYLYDMIEHLANHPPTDGWVVIADSDCVWLHSSARMSGLILTDGLGTLTVGYDDPEQRIDGLSRNRMWEAMPQLGLSKPDSPPRYCGGELVGLTPKSLAEITALSRALFARLLKLHAENPEFVCEEAHMLSMIASHLAYPVGNLNPTSKRIWTSRSYRSTAPEDVELDLWHLPSEKRYGFVDLYRLVKNNRQLLTALTPDQYESRLAQLMGIPTPPLPKLIRDRSRLLKFKLVERLGRR